MKIKQVIFSVILVVIGIAAATYIMRMKTSEVSSGGHHGHHDEHGHEEEGHDDGEIHEDEAARGPHNGRMLTEKDFSLELSIFETGIPPQYRAYLFVDGEQVAPENLKMQVLLYRLGGWQDTINFTRQNEFMLGNRTIEEPHSFDVHVTAEYMGNKYSWEFESIEGRVEMEPGAVQASGIAVDTAGPAIMKSTLVLNGKTIPNEDKLAHIYARYPGVVKKVRRHLGEKVNMGDTLAIIESNETLKSYAITSQIAGSIISKHITTGETVGADEELYVVTDLRSVWVDFTVYRQDFPKLKRGQKILIEAGDQTKPLKSRLAYLSPVGSEHTQSMTARAEIPNNGAWPPGIFVKGEVTLKEFKVPLAVKAEALQTFRDWDVVFINSGNFFEARPVETGRRNSNMVEIKSGLKPGEFYVTTNSFVIKADIGKAGASHDH